MRDNSLITATFSDRAEEDALAKCREYVEDGGFHATPKGVPQGGLLSPLCGNVMFNKPDKEPEYRDHKFVRYADDCMLLCKSRKTQKGCWNISSRSSQRSYA